MNIKRAINISICVIIFLLVYVVVQLSKENTAEKGNAITLLAKTQAIEDSLSKKRQEVGLLKLTVEELEQYRTKYTEVLKELEIRNEDVKELLSATSAIEQRYETVLRDSVTIHYDTIKVYDYADDYTAIHGTIKGDTIQGNVTLTDTITIVKHVERKKFLCIRYGIKSEKLTITNANPNVKINNIEIIEIIK